MKHHRFLAVAALLTSLVVASGQPAHAATDWSQVSTGGSHTCGIRVGQLWCWGANDSYQIGDNTTSPRVRPKRITLASDWAFVSAGGTHTCGIRIGKLYCWGHNENHETGDSTADPYVRVPRQITTATDWTSVSAGAVHTCALRAGGKLYCWGNNGYGQMGTGAVGTGSIRPVQVGMAVDWTSVRAGFFHTCGIRSPGQLFCWGFNNRGQLGDRSIQTRPSPVPVTAATDWIDISVGSFHSCAIRRGGRLYCWGSNADGQMGTGSTATANPVPVLMSSITDWTRLAAGGEHTCAIRVDRRLYCWGRNDNGQVGNHTQTRASSPMQITLAADWFRIDGGIAHTCAIRINAAGDPALYCWGRNQAGQLGLGAASDTVVQTQPAQVTYP